jgi:hypothetical protein
MEIPPQFLCARSFCVLRARNAADLITSFRLSEALFADRYNWIYPVTESVA